LPAVRERKGVTAMYPANQAVDEILGRLGGSVTAADETLFSTLSAVSATMSAHFAFLQSIPASLGDQGWEQADADHFIRGQFVGLGTTLAETDTPIKELVAGHETPGGLNEQLNREWMDEANRGRLAAALDAVYARVTGAADRAARPAGPAAEQSRDVPVLGDVDLQCGGFAREAGHRHDVTGDDDDEAGTGRQPHVLDLDDVVGRGPAQTAIGAQRVLGLGHADGCIAVAFLGELAQLALDLGRQVDIGGLVDPLGDGADLLLQRAVEVIAVARTRGGI